jgi:type I restriction enzyme S subunit
MRSGWNRVTLGDVLTEIHRPVAVENLSEVRYAGVRWYTEGVYARDPVPASEVKTATVTELRAGDVTYNRMWATKGSFGIAGEEVDGCHVTNDFPIFMIDESMASRPFIALVFETASFLAEAASRATGTTERRRLKQRDFLAIPIALPPVLEQRRIVDLIAHADEAVRSAVAEYSALGHLRRSAWRHYGGGSTRVDLIGEVSQGRSLPKAIQGSNSGDIPWFKIADMTSPANIMGYVSAETSVSAEVLAANGGRITPAGSVAFPRVGAAVATEKKRLLEVDAALDENHIAVTPFDSATSEVLLAAFDSIMLGGLARSGAVPSLNMGLVRTLELPWPETADLVVLVDDLLGTIRRCEAATRLTAEALRAVRSDLLTVLMSGEHEMSSSYDELLGEAAA